jgi:predicted nucleic acid-binding protein
VAIVVLDASVVIGFLDAEDAHHRASVAALAARRGAELVLPVSAYTEALVGPFRQGPGAVATVERFVVDFAMRVEPLSAEMARRAAALRARHARLRLPDALVLATADVLDAAQVRSWPRVSRRARTI